jgi:hypothetical protein
MKINLPCTCDQEEHEIEVWPEYGFGTVAWDGTGEGDVLPCGRIVTETDTQFIYDRITNNEDDY